jgi:hypothetical protein
MQVPLLYEIDEQLTSSCPAFKIFCMTVPTLFLVLFILSIFTCKALAIFHWKHFLYSMESMFSCVYLEYGVGILEH